MAWMCWKKLYRRFDQDALVFFRTKNWSRSGHLYTWILCLFTSRLAHGSSAGVAGSRELVQLVLASCFLRAAIQHPGISRSVSLLRHSSVGAIGCWWLPWVAALWGIWVCHLLSSPPIWWSGGPSKHALLLLTSLESLSGRHPDAPSASLRSFMQ